MQLPIVACVLKSGVWRPRQTEEYAVSYGPHHVQWLAEQFARQVKRPHRFVCLTDLDIPGVETRPLQDDLPGWWSKIELFREFSEAAYVDLDTVIVGDVSSVLFNGHNFTVSAGVNIVGHTQINSSLMCWNGDYSFFYDEFIERREEIIAAYTSYSRWGDQGFLRDMAAGRVIFERFQRKYPGAVLSYKRDLKPGRFIQNRHLERRVTYGKVYLTDRWQNRPRVVMFNGAEKPWNVREEWIPELAA